MDEFEIKKWVVERVEQTIQTILNFQNKGEIEFQHFVDMEIKIHREVQKGTLSLGVFLTTLVLGLASLSLEWINVEFSLFIIFLMGSIVYGVTTFFKYKVNSELREVNSRILKGQAAIFYPKAFILSKSVNLDKQSVDDYRLVYYYLTRVIEPSLYLPGYFAVKKLKKSRVLSKSGRKEMQSWETFYENSLKQGIEDFKKMRKNYEASPLTNEMIGFGELLLEYENGQEPDIESLMKE